MEYLTYIGGTESERGEAITLDAEGVVHMAGVCHSSDLHTTVNAYCQTQPGTSSIMMARIVPKAGVPASAPSVFEATPDDWEVLLKWGRPTDEGGCILMNYSLYRFDGTEWQTLYQGTNLSFHDVDVISGRTYRYRVTAWTLVGEGDHAELHAKVLIKAPGVPGDLDVTTGNGSVVLNWTPPQDTGGDRIKAYVIQRGIERDDLQKLATVGNVTIYEDGDVEIGQFYYYALAAVNDAGQGPFGDTRRVKALDRPDPPRTFVASAGDGRVDLSWDLPTKTGGTMLLGMKIYKGTNPDNIQLLATISGSLTYRDTDVVNGISYLYYLTSFTNVGESVPTTPLDVIPFGLPGFVTDISAMAGDGNVTLTWTPPSSDGGRPITKYIIRWGEDPGSLINRNTIGNVTTFLHKDLDNGVKYHYKVSALSEGGEGRLSETVSATPMGLPGPVSDLTAVAVRNGIRLTWKPPEDLGGADSVKVWIIRGDPDAPEFDDSVIGSLEFLDTNVTPGVTYHYWARTETSFGNGPLVGPVELIAVTVPGAVRDVATSYGDGQVHITWSAPEDDGGSSIMEYIVKRGIFVTGIVEVARVSTTDHTDTGLDNGKEYLYVVVAVNALRRPVIKYCGPWEIADSRRSPPLAMSQPTQTWT
jgi:titin